MWDVTPCYLIAGYEPHGSEGRLRDVSTTRRHVPEDSEVCSHCLEKQSHEVCFSELRPLPLPLQPLRLLLPLLLTTYLWGSGGATQCILLLSCTRGEGSASLGHSIKGLGTPLTPWTVEPKASLRRDVEFL